MNNLCKKLFSYLVFIIMKKYVWLCSFLWVDYFSQNSWQIKS
ncbi:hypothetical protein HMPREF1872_01357 [Amygdalobacter nucleatus]|uniref:Uncharacterized protein n=1 Tax=Amygdalobacter nucleatus TaxID=3029274 RepID=A0A133Y7G6_9FIRM|nr:hypothetical protein HMPREF1872_01357 [Amygdalobacter nucleatus]